MSTEPRHGGRLPDPGLAAVCGRCGEPREAHGGPKHYGACPDEHGLKARRFSIAAEDRPEPVSTELERRMPVMIGSVLPARPAKVTVTVELDNVLHSDCGRYVSEHVQGNGHYCDDPLEAAGWTPPGNCAGGCR